MPRLYRLLLPLWLICSTSWTLTATAQATAKIYLTAAKAQQIADSLDALPDCRLEARKWHHIADSTQDKAITYQRQAGEYLDAKRAAENSEQFQRNITASKQAEVDEYKSKAHRRGFVVFLLIAADVTVAVLAIAL